MKLVFTIAPFVVIIVVGLLVGKYVPFQTQQATAYDPVGGGCFQQEGETIHADVRGRLAFSKSDLEKKYNLIADDQDVNLVSGVDPNQICVINYEFKFYVW